MKLFKQKGWHCEHLWRKKGGACQKCLFNDWFWCSTGGHVVELILVIITYPIWYLKWGRHMDKQGFMEGERK